MIWLGAALGSWAWNYALLDDGQRVRTERWHRVGLAARIPNIVAAMTRATKAGLRRLPKDQSSSQLLDRVLGWILRHVVAGRLTG